MVDTLVLPKDSVRYALTTRLNAIDLPPANCHTVNDPISLMRAIAVHGTQRASYFADPRLLRRLIYWQDTTALEVESWLNELVDAGEVLIQPLGLSCYSGDAIDVVTVVNYQRFKRTRAPIPQEVRQAVYDRDGRRCLHCGSKTSLSLDHIYPWSLGGSDDADNLQTLCQSCNSGKGART